MRSMPAIYKNYHFDSRTEARIAFWMDLVGLEWGYETDVLKLEKAGKEDITYIPDFLVKPFPAVLEAKGTLLDGMPGLRVLDKCERLALEIPVILCFGDILDSKCALFFGTHFFADCKWTMCRHCGSAAIGVRKKEGEPLSIWCPDKEKHQPTPLTLAQQRQRNRFLYEAVTQARQRKFAWPKKKAS